MADFLSKIDSDAGQKKPRAKRKLGSKANQKGLHDMVAADEQAVDVVANTLGESILSNESPSRDLAAVRTYLTALGLFDVDFYVSNYSDVALTGDDPFEHFFLRGFKEGRKPNAIFDPIWYVTTYPDVHEAGIQPLLHYAIFGEREGRRPSPYFQPNWYRDKYGIPEGQSPLAHYMKNRAGPFSPIQEFDAQYYLDSYQDVAAAKVDPFEHFIFHGYKEGRNPSPDFDTKFYIQRYFKGRIDQNPLLHYLEHRHEEGIYPIPPENEATIPAEVRRFTKPSVLFEELRPLPPTAKPRAKVLAYYLTQFHAFPENDKWWGAGFTEWANISRGLPRFKDHYQPRVPRDLGFYSLLDIENMRRQVEFAKASGIHGFVYYYYWFNGKRLMEKPLEQFLKARDIDMPFCLMWANENWTRRWDGLESEVLISQDYADDDDERLLGDFCRHFEDPRYIRIQGRPLLMIYRPRLIPAAATVIARWRTIFKTRFGEDPIIIMGQSFDDFDPTVMGLDGAIEFPPHKVTKYIPLLNSEVKVLDDTFSGQIFSYDDVAKYSIKEPRPKFPLIKTAVPSWDNDARRQGSGLVIHGSTPQKYEAWLSKLVDDAQRHPFFGESFVCINAWNEWCEGAYLEPDLHFGSAYLNATGRAAAGLTRDRSQPKVLLVGHDAFPGGAQHLLLNIGRTLLSAFNIETEYLLLDGGTMVDEYSASAPLTVLSKPSELPSALQRFREMGFTAAIVNTTASGHAVKLLADMGFRTVSLVHELPRILREKRLEDQARAAISIADSVVFASEFVLDKLADALEFGRDDERFLIRPQGSYKQIFPAPDEAAAIRSEFGLAQSDKLVLGVGYADLRKGIDMFLQLWNLVGQNNRSIHFCWAGGIDPSVAEWLGPEIQRARMSGRFHFTGFRSDMQGLYSASNVYALTSREDPFPTVALEALSVGVPVVAFADAGGIPGFLLEEEVGAVVPYCDVPAMAKAVERLLSRPPSEAERARMTGLIEARFLFSDYVRELLHLALPALPAVSVVVPNYNYAHCLPERLCTIFDQNHSVEEIIVLDDCSKDDSISVIVKIAEERQRDLTLVVNEQNSGSVFAQWSKAAEMAKGEFLWIAEADDLSEPNFLSSLLELMRNDADIALGFTDSKAIDGEGQHLYESYKPYYASIEPDALSRTEVFDAGDFVGRFLGVKNTILNVSSVLWRREALLRALDACHEDLDGLRMAGDWRIYLECLSAPDAKIAYVADPLNVHRRHAASVTHSMNAQKHIEEIERMHRVARELFGLRNGEVRAQEVYIKEVAAQLLGPAPSTESRMRI
ncbi:glycoside hydrolase family 99-like domain-containing protein [Rhodopseudomonas sp. HC1]|uniref:glycoside hydrolase family 99-like domain-containing protein n=1 Tax=Rhodopseudomonas infernalis TaxID=2897386 RepID=UPI001EE7A53C|nr:glycoside hydrolase family 99-like domain-containing protein [Rhodopseudomonas infernalis]MCG6205519.1 glycoside hydrolase family 99-like domain-containing protein [Rhodopseudomonas infernalis]